MLDHLKWEPWPNNPDNWLWATPRIAVDRWLCLGQGIGTRIGEFVASVHNVDPKDKRVANGNEFETWEGDNGLAFVCIVHDFVTRYGDERSANGGLRRAGDEAQGGAVSS